MDWTKLNETIDPRWHNIDAPIPVYHSKEKMEPKQIYISTANPYNDEYHYLMKQYKEYLDRMAYQYSCTAPTYYIKVSEDFSNYLAARYKDEIIYDKRDWDESTGITGYFEGTPIVVDSELGKIPYKFELPNTQLSEGAIDKFNSIGCTSFILTPEQIEELLDKEINK